MPFGIGLYKSAGARFRKLNFVKKQKEAFDAILPVLQDTGKQLISAADREIAQLDDRVKRLGTQGLAFGGRRAQSVAGSRAVGGIDRSLEAIAPFAGRAAETAFGNTRIGSLANTVGKIPGVPTSGGDRTITDFARKPFVPTGETIRRGTEFSFRNPLEAAQREADFGRPITGPAGKALGTGVADLITPRTPRPLRALGVPEFNPAADSIRSGAGRVGEAVLPELAVATNLIPFEAPAIAAAKLATRGAGAGIRAGARAGARALPEPRAGLRPVAALDETVPPLREGPEVADVVARTPEAAGPSPIRTAPSDDVRFDVDEVLSEGNSASRVTNKERIAQSVDADVDTLLARVSDEPASDVVKDAYRQAKELGITEELAPDSLVARKAPRIAAVTEDLSAKFQGRVQGGVGDIAERASMLEHALGESARETVDKLTLSINRTLTGRFGRGGVLDSIEYVGPPKFADAANGPHKALVLASSPPEWWKGVPQKLLDDMEELRAFAQKRKSVAESLGYPSEASIDNYLRQEWEEVDEALRLFSGKARGGLISASKGRVIPNYAIGINAGLTPTAKSVGELMADSVALWDRAIAESFERKLVLGRFGTKGGRRTGTGAKVPFSHPLYKGFSAEREVVNAVEGLHTPVGKVTRTALNVAAPFKNTVFGPLDIGVLGVQGLKALTSGGVQLFANSIVRSLALLRLAPAQHFREALESGPLPKLVKMANGGLHLGLGPSAVTPGKGTVAKYIPFIGDAVDKPLSAFIDAKSRVEFGMILNWLRVQLAEGNLLMLHLAGRDINDPATFKTGMDWANTMTGASRGAQTPGRKATETAGLTSFQMARSELATLGAPMKAAVSGTGDEKLLAMMSLASFGAMVYGVGSAVNMAFGNGPIEFNPQDGKWATIEIKGKNVPIIPQRGLIRAIAKSITELEKLDEAEGDRLAKIWTQYVVSKGSPAVQVGTSVAGFGFEPGVGFQAGDLEPKFRFLNALPMPPLLSSAVVEGETDPTSVAFGGAGFNPFPVSAFDRFKEAFKEETNQDYDPGEGHRTIAEGNPELASLLEKADKEGGERGFEGALNREQREAFGAEGAERLRPFVEGVRAGNPQAGEQFREQFSQWKTLQAGAAGIQTFGVDFGEADSEAQQALNDLGELNPFSPEFMDTDATSGEFRVDWDAYEQRRDELIDIVDRSSPGYREAYEARLRLPEEFQDVERTFLEAKRLRDQLDAISPVKGLPADAHDQIRDFLRIVDRQRQEWRLEGREVELENAIKLVASKEGKSAGFVKWAIRLRSGVQADRRNPEWDRFLVQNESTLRLFYPSLYSARVDRQIGGIPEERTRGGLRRPQRPTVSRPRRPTFAR